MPVFAQTALVGQAAAGHFDGVYTYDILVYGGDTFARLCRQAHAARLLCAPSVGPGYDARAAAGDPRVKPRQNGATYDCDVAAPRSPRSADLVTITSYNEWHEGTQIEPARAARRGYGTATTAPGASRASRPRRAYLDRTAYWADGRSRAERRHGRAR